MITFREKLKKLSESKGWVTSGTPFSECINNPLIYPNEIGIWEKSMNSGKYLKEELENYFIEIIREELPELRGVKVEFRYDDYKLGNKPIIKII